MRIPLAPRTPAGGLVVTALGVCTLLVLAIPAPTAPPIKKATPDQIVLAWVDGGKQLQIDAYGYRPSALVDIRLGSDPIQQTRAGAKGQVQVSVPDRLITAGQPGASVIVIGRSRLGTARTLFSAVPPRATARGPIDELPYVLGFAALAWIVWAALRRQRRAVIAAARETEQVSD